MLLERLGLALTLPVLLYACASGVPPAPVIPPGPAVPPALNPVGVYDIVAALEGLTLYVELTIEGSSEAGYSGQVADPRGATAVTGIEVTGQTLAFAVPELGVRLRLEFEGDDFTGQMTGQAGDAIISGSRRR